MIKILFDNNIITNIIVIVTMNAMVCTFCKNKGIPPPHNHTVRNWTLPDKPVICPNLLACQCTYCKMNGHTKQYCPIKKSFNESLNKCSGKSSPENNLKREFESMNIISTNSNKIQKR